MLGDKYAGLVSSVRRLQGIAVRAADGRAVDARADEMFAVFKEAESALDAAIAIQQKVGTRKWPRNALVRIRMGLHTGRPTLSQTGYTGLVVHIAARVCSAAHGGEILLSQATREALDGSMPKGVSVREIGRYELHGLPSLETLYQADVAPQTL
jgi:class 3 adenylate cyclase